MADFLISYGKMQPKERGWADNPADRGGETWNGIARKKHPRWGGWHLIDEVRYQPGFPEILGQIAELRDAEREFYREEFWRPILGEQLPQAIADELFEASVNCGTGNGVRFLQIALNLLNRNNALYRDVEVDGRMGHDTLGAVQSCLVARGEPRLLQFMNQSQGNYYWDLMLRDPTQEEFALGWYDRTRT